MAATRIGGALLSATVQTLVEKLASTEFLDYIKNTKLNVSLMRQLQTILLSLQAVLDDAEEKQINNHSVKRWLDDLKDAVFDAQDLLNKIDNDFQRCKVESIKAGTKSDQVWNFLSSPFNNFYREMNSQMKIMCETLQLFALNKDILGLQIKSARVSSRSPSSLRSHSLTKLTRQKDGNEIKIINNIVEQVSRKFDRVPLQNEATFRKIAQTMLQILHRVFQAEMTWRLVGLMSSVVGLLCYALSPSFNRLIGRWKPFKLFVYGALSLAIFTTILFAKQTSTSTQHVQLKTYTSFAVLIIISVYSFFYDKAVNGKPEMLSIVSNAAFALVSLSLHKLIRFGFELGVFSYFLGCFAVQLFTINWMLIFVAIFFGCPLFVMHSSLNSQPDVASADQVIHSPSLADAV